MGDLNDARKEGTENRTHACNMGRGPFRIRPLGHVRAEMRNGNARLLTGSSRAQSRHLVRERCALHARNQILPLRDAVYRFQAVSQLCHRPSIIFSGSPDARIHLLR